MELKEWKKIHTNPNAADFYRRMYPGVVVRGYHCPPVQQPYWNTIELEQFDEETAELKRVFVDKDYRGKGIAKELLRRIEADARISGYRFMVLETGALLQDARGLYTKVGYKLIPNFEPYVNMPQSICMRKKI